MYTIYISYIEACINPCPYFVKYTFMIKADDYDHLYY